MVLLEPRRLRCPMFEGDPTSNQDSPKQQPLKDRSSRHGRSMSRLGNEQMHVGTDVVPNVIHLGNALGMDVPCPSDAVQGFPLRNHMDGGRSRFSIKRMPVRTSVAHTSKSRELWLCLWAKAMASFGSCARSNCSQTCALGTVTTWRLWGENNAQSMREMPRCLEAHAPRPVVGLGPCAGPWFSTPPKGTQTDPSSTFEGHSRHQAKSTPTLLPTHRVDECSLERRGVGKHRRTHLGPRQGPCLPSQGKPGTAWPSRGGGNAWDGPRVLTNFQTWRATNATRKVFCGHATAAHLAR